MDILISNLLRPYRSTYSSVDLGKKRTDHYVRTDASLYNDREMLMQYSYYEQIKKTDVCVVYCHCNSGSRIEGKSDKYVGVQYLEQFIEKGWNVCLFDFSGSGQSEGAFISLGHYESRDLESILKKLRLLGNRRFLLWGRSMGAATSKLSLILSHLLPQRIQIPRRYHGLCP
jgi:predicted alpha/beta-fold hydrolase